MYHKMNDYQLGKDIKRGMKKRLLALFINLTLIASAIPVYAAEDSTDYIAIEEESVIEDSDSSDVVDDSYEIEDSYSDTIEEESEESDAQEEVTIVDDSEADSEYIVEEEASFDGKEEYSYGLDSDDASDEKQEIIAEDLPDDPENFRHSFDEEEEEIGLNMGEDGYYFMGEGAVNPDPFVFRYNTSRRYSYPQWHKTADDSKRVPVRYGMDISRHQGTVSESSFRTLKNTYGIDFVIIRAGFRGYGQAGNTGKDICFEANIKNAINAGLNIGVYYFSQAITEDEAREEADKCIEIIKPYKSNIKLPVVIDYEYSGDSTTAGRLKNANLSAAQHTAIVNAFCKKVAQAGYYPGIYANKNMFEKDMVMSSIPKDYYIWMANYVSPDSNGLCATSFSGRLETWQFTSKFTGFGTTGDKLITSQYLDLNFWFGAYPTKYTLSYVANGGVGSISSVSGREGDKVKVSANKFSRDGYTFKEWNTKADGSGKGYQPGDEYAFVAGENVLYAIWKKIDSKFTVSFVTDCDATIADQIHTYGELVTEPAALEKEGYEFSGWYKDSSLIQRWDFGRDVVKHDLILYAGWNAYDVSAEEVTIEGVRDVDYTGKAVTFDDLTVYCGSRLLEPGKDYTVKYAGNTKAGKASVTITGKGNYTGRKTVYFQINRLVITDKIDAPAIELKYTGKVQKGTTTVVYKAENGSQVTLKAGKDFTYIYPGTDKKSAGYDSSAYVGVADEDTDYEVIIEGKGNYIGQASFKETILKKSDTGIPVSKLKVGKISAQQLRYDNDGAIISAMPKPVIKDGGKVLDEVKDAEEDGYTLIYENNKAVGTGFLYITGTGKYYGTRKVDFKINPITMSKVKVDGLQSVFSYTGKEIKQTECELKYEGLKLIEGRDYTVSYSANINVSKKATVIFTGKGIYSGTLKKTYTISSESLYDVEVYADSEVVYTKGRTIPKVDAVYVSKDGNEYVLIKDKDFTVKCTNNTAVNSGLGSKRPTVTITGKGNFTGKVAKEFAITKSSLENTVMTASDIVYTGKTGIPKPKIQITDSNRANLTAGTDYNNVAQFEVVDENGNHLEDYNTGKAYPAGTYVRATVSGKGNYAGSTQSAIFRIVNQDISKATIKIADQYYTGGQVRITDKSQVQFKLGKNVVTADDFVIEYDKNVKYISVGTYKVTIKGVGNYGGQKVVTFKIKGRKVSK